MLSTETLEAYRRLTPAERLQLTFELCRPAWKALTEGDPKLVARRLARLRQENSTRTRRISEGFRRSEQRLIDTPMSKPDA
ncbi:hypothetical protein [Novipirellula artificiosorum]|uniref:Uncharacterized protein n=1 Tax=Novipirellula artificiosorum TaxID=2528016 RepID=A0A5C6D5Z8_9BACT|nr:hypothetical protein [Novipirellula artificiosorum]TWU32593.1 hypothetical protein Poly41_55710 [Novipirellula artificiosorum]